MTLHDQIREKKAELDRIGVELDTLLNQCPAESGECGICAMIICPSKDSMHFHHDGCPSCAVCGWEEEEEAK